MPQVPTIDETDVQPEQEQFAGVPTPPQGAYPGAVGSTVEALGSEIGRIAFEEQQKTNEVKAMEAETEYQTYLSQKVYDVNNGFSSIYGRAALAQAPGVKADITDKREEIATRLGSRYAQRLFDNNSLRTLRFAQDHVDAWAGAQRRTADDVSYKLSLASAAQYASQLASSPIGYHPEAADALMSQTQTNAYRRAAQRGDDEDTAQDFAAKSLSIVADSLVMGLAKTGANTEIASHELDRWGKFMSPTKQAEAAKLIVAQGVKNQAAKILQDADRVSADPRIEADSDGKVSVDSYESMIQNAKHADGTALSDGERSTLRHETERQLVDLNKEFGARVRDTEGRITAAGVKGGHAFIIDRGTSADDLEWMRINAPIPLALLEKQSRDNGDYELRGSTRSDKRTSQLAFLNFQDKVLKMRDEHPDQFAALRERDTLGLSMDPPDQRQAWRMIQKYQKPDTAKLPGGSIRSQIVDKLDSIYERNTGAKDHVRRYLLNKATNMDFKGDQGAFDKWLDSEFQSTGGWFKSYQVEQEVEQSDAALKAAAPVPPPQGPDQKTVYLGKARKFHSDPLATKAQKDWADLIFTKYNEKP